MTRATEGDHPPSSHKLIKAIPAVRFGEVIGANHKRERNMRGALAEQGQRIKGAPRKTLLCLYLANLNLGHVTKTSAKQGEALLKGRHLLTKGVARRGEHPNLIDVCA
jgi:hypothetical protein